MNHVELALAGIMAVTTTLLLWRRHLVNMPPRAQVYECQVPVQDRELAVAYRDAPFRPCGQRIKLVDVKGHCTPLCSIHEKPMTRLP